MEMKTREELEAMRVAELRDYANEIGARVIQSPKYMLVGSIIEHQRWLEETGSEPGTKRGVSCDWRRFKINEER